MLSTVFPVLCRLHACTVTHRRTAHNHSTARPFSPRLLTTLALLFALLAVLLWPEAAPRDGRNSLSVALPRCAINWKRPERPPAP